MSVSRDLGKGKVKSIGALFDPVTVAKGWQKGISPNEKSPKILPRSPPPKKKWCWCCHWFDRVIKLGEVRFPEKQQQSGFCTAKYCVHNSPWFLITDARCPDESWQQYEDWCYLINFDNSFSHDDAITACTNHNADATLTSIHSEGEQVFLAGMYWDTNWRRWKPFCVAKYNNNTGKVMTIYPTVV